jgi:hypothetical protein
MTRLSAGMLLVAGISLSAASVAFGADVPTLVTQTSLRNMIQEALNASPAFSEVAKGKKLVPSTMIRYRATRAGATTESDLVEALHFNYDDGKTIRTLYDLTDKKVIKVDALEAYPTPLANQEIAEAKKLASEKDERAKALLQKYRDNEISVGALAPVIADRANKRFGKRLAILVLAPIEPCVLKGD